MNATQLEALVIRAVDAVRRGDGNEDDRIEFKREWPNGKARQLAGAANQADGEDLVYVIGFDESNGSVHPTSDTDAAEWWGQTEAQFDAVAPELVRHLVVQVAEGESVTALQFRTDRRPYVVKTQGGAEREVPIRAGTRTRSAYRHELIRMLYPAASAPQVTPVEAALAVRLRSTGEVQSGAPVIVFKASIYFELADGAQAFLPYHGAVAVLRGAGREYEAPLRYWGKKTTPDDAVHARTDGVQLGGPGVAHFSSHVKVGVPEYRELLQAKKWEVTMAFQRANASVPVVAKLHLANRVRLSAGLVEDDGSSRDGVKWELESTDR